VAPTSSPDPYAPIIADFQAAMTMMRCASSERVLRLGISVAQLHILYTLRRNGQMPMSRLAEVLNVSLSNATGLIDRIEERGFVDRTRVPEDRGHLDRSKLAGVGQAVAALRDALGVATGGKPADRHSGSIPSPRSSSTLRGVERPTQTQKD
jgi:predicted transcriptional regulator